MEKTLIYTIKEASELSGLPESTLRYYETIGLLGPINRGSTSKQREYTERNIDEAISIACLNATGMSIEDMRAYLGNRTQGVVGARDQVALLENHTGRLADEAYYLQLRQRYVDTKISYWKAVAEEDSEQAQAMSKNAKLIAKELKFTREKLGQ
ncbi:MAG: MerR family transcriptional regulator [Chloroflexi bacterium]|nr:MerR family transcriptional regulator [Chloroflexota bacterium]OJV92193.1 MAG: hypothetical protein BGO39_09500 [Chloroflexi bacterium 54-19]